METERGEGERERERESVHRDVGDGRPKAQSAESWASENSQTGSDAHLISGWINAPEGSGMNACGRGVEM